MSLMQIDAIEAGYGAQMVLRGLSLDLAQGEMAALIGPNGHGKTTLLRCISGLVRPRSGSIRFAGRRIDGLRPDEVVAAGIVHVPQGDMLFSEMTVLENLMMGAYLPDAARNQAERLEQVYALLPKLKQRSGQIACTLSGGERRMVGIGRGLMAGAKLLMLDEPSLGLAPIVIDQIYEVIAGLRDAGHTVLIVEENASRIAEYADRLHLLDNGEFAWVGSGKDLLSRPEILATYLGG